MLPTHWLISHKHPCAPQGEPEYLFWKEETGKLQYPVAAVWPPGCLSALSQGSLCQEMPHTETFPSPSSCASLPLCPAHFSPSAHCHSSREHTLQRALQEARAVYLPFWGQGKLPLALAASNDMTEHGVGWGSGFSGSQAGGTILERVWWT